MNSKHRDHRNPSRFSSGIPSPEFGAPETSGSGPNWFEYPSLAGESALATSPVPSGRPSMIPNAGLMAKVLISNIIAIKTVVFMAIPSRAVTSPSPVALQSTIQNRQSPMWSGLPPFGGIRRNWEPILGRYCADPCGETPCRSQIPQNEKSSLRSKCRSPRAGPSTLPGSGMVFSPRILYAGAQAAPGPLAGEAVARPF